MHLLESLEAPAGASRKHMYSLETPVQPGDAVQQPALQSYTWLCKFTVTVTGHGSGYT
jgi:hypothetical protein